MRLRLPRPVELEFGESFNGTTSLVNFGPLSNVSPSGAPHYALAQTCIALVYPVAVGELATNTVLQFAPAGSNSGIRLKLADTGGTSPSASFSANSSGSGGNPQKTGQASIYAYTRPMLFAAAWGGDRLASDIDLYSSTSQVVNFPITADGSPSSTSDGTTAGAPPANNAIYTIGNRDEATRTFNGYVYWVTRILGKLSQEQIQEVQKYGPLIFWDRMLMMYINGEDIGPYGLQVKNKTAVTRVDVRPEYRYQIGYLPTSRSLYFLPTFPIVPQRSVLVAQAINRAANF